MFKKAFMVDNNKIDIWIQAILACPFDTTIYVGEKLLFSGKDGKRQVVRALAYETNKSDQLTFVEKLVSELCYTHGMIKNLSGRYPYNVRKDDQKVSGENKPSSGEHSEHLNEGNRGNCEGEDFGIASQCNPGSNFDITSSRADLGV